MRSSPTWRWSASCRSRPRPPPRTARADPRRASSHSLGHLHRETLQRLAVDVLDDSGVLREIERREIDVLDVVIQHDDVLIGNGLLALPELLLVFAAAVVATRTTIRNMERRFMASPFIEWSARCHPRRRRLQRAVFGGVEADTDGLAAIRRQVERLQQVAGVLVQVRIRRQRGQDRAGAVENLRAPCRTRSPSSFRTR